MLGKDDLTKKLYISGCVVSASAKAKIEKAGGKII
ncbi:MAG: uL15m family ribosomal protein [bacterium]|nr:uL15m family ribosomal protein [bacterium]